MNDLEQPWRGLMLKAQAGNKAAYEALLKNLCPYLRHYLRPRLSQTEIVEDVVQEVLLAVHTARHTWQPDEPFLPWLHGIVRYKMADALRVVYRRNSHETVDTDLIVTLSASMPNKNTEGSSLDMDTMLATLTPRQRALLRLNKLEGHTAAETGKQLGMSSAAVKVAIHRIINQLKQQFGTGR